MLVVSDLANVLKDSLGFTTFLTSSQTTGFAQAIVTILTVNATVNNAPGTVTGTAPAGGSLIGGTSSSGTILGVTASTLASLMQSNMGYPSVSSQLSGMATAIATHITTSATVSFSLITGSCTNGPTSPGVLIGQGTGGTIGGISGPVLATIMASQIGQSTVSTQLGSFCGALVNYIKDHGSVTYTSGQVTGICPSGGGPISGGAGTGGKIS